MQWQKETIVLDDHTTADAQAPVIISASRATDIPTFYSDWFISRWEAGYIKWMNPFNNQPLYVSFKNVRTVVFWTKNPRPMFKYLDYMDQNIPNYYFQFTLNDYDQERFEAKVPKLEKRIEAFKELSQRLGKKRVVWRFDPLMLTDTIDVTELLRRIKNIGDQLHSYTEKLVISFADIGSYKKVENNLKKEEIPYIEFTQESMEAIARGLQELNIEWGLDIGTCSEKIDLEEFNITHNRCVDDDLMIELFSHDKELMDFLGVEITPADLFSDGNIVKKRNLKDKGQREDCGCIMSKDIGQYNTCPHECNYCYANVSKELAKKNYQNYLKNPKSESIV
jgi:DNA repair photolyase